MSEGPVDAIWEDPERVEEFARKPPDHRLQALIGAEPDPRSLRALDVGCAGGRNAVFLAEQGVDVSEAASRRLSGRRVAVGGRSEAGQKRGPWVVVGRGSAVTSTQVRSRRLLRRFTP